MSLLKKFYIFPLLMVSAFVLSACTQDEDEPTDGSGSRVRVINDEDETGDGTANDDTPDVIEIEDEPEEEVEVEDDPEEEEEVEDDAEPIISADGLQEINGATSADNIALSTYGYGTVGGKFQFGFVGRDSTGLSYAKATAGFDQNGDLVVTFPSLKADYIRDAGTNPIVLGSGLPDIEIVEIDGGTRYIFKFGAEKEFVIRGVSETSETLIEVTL